MRKVFLLAVLPFVLAACSSEPPVSVELGQNSAWGNTQLWITAIDDETVINGVEVNRGNCSPRPHEKLPYKIIFGRTLKVEAGCNNVLEARIKTNVGDFDFTFK